MTSDEERRDFTRRISRMGEASVLEAIMDLAAGLPDRLRVKALIGRTGDAIAADDGVEQHQDDHLRTLYSFKFGDDVVLRVSLPWKGRRPAWMSHDPRSLVAHDAAHDARAFRDTFDDSGPDLGGRPG